MNTITLKGFLRNIQYSHTINGVEYNKAELIVPNDTSEDDILSIRFKKFSNPYDGDQQVEFIGNVRSYSEKLGNNKNKVSIYVFTYFDTPKSDEDGRDIINEFELDGRVCKVDKLRVTEDGRQNFHFILANNIISNDGRQKLNNYIPMVCWGKLAIENQELQVSDKIKVKGQLHSRTYKKIFPDGTVEIKVAHEGVLTSIEKI